VLFQHFQLPTDGTVGDVQLLGRQADAAQAGSGFKSAQGIEGREVAAHDMCEFS